MMIYRFRNMIYGKQVIGDAMRSIHVPKVCITGEACITQRRYFCCFAYEFEFLQKNEILAIARMKSAFADEIFGSASDEIKSVLSPNEVGFHREAISSTIGGFIPSARTDLVEKSTCNCKCFFLVHLSIL